MEKLDPQPSVTCPAEMFTGDVYFDVLSRGEHPSRMRVNTVRFTPCARTAWHSHSLGQTIHVTDGLGIVATRDQVIVMRPGDTVHTPPGQEHWHGAAPDHFMSHLAMCEDDDASWGDHVSDAQYEAAVSHPTPHGGLSHGAPTARPHRRPGQPALARRVGGVIVAPRGPTSWRGAEAVATASSSRRSSSCR